MNQWFGFFVGTPKRLLTTITVIALACATVRPDVVQTALNNLMTAIFAALTPFLGPALQLALIAGVGIWVFKRLLK